MDFSRTDRISSSMQKAIAQIVRDEVKDPRLGLVTIQDVRVVRDLSQAKVYFTLLGDGDRDEAQKILQKASGYIRRQLGKAVNLRSLPELHFVYDTSIEDGNHLHALIEKAVRDDEHSPSEDNGED